MTSDLSENRYDPGSDIEHAQDRGSTLADYWLILDWNDLQTSVNRNIFSPASRRLPSQRRSRAQQSLY
jgi:hypothetical protein